jgi:uncharacterized protein (TIGR02246 family)
MNDEHAVKMLHRQWAEAHMRRDAAALKSLYADDFTYTDFTGTVWDKGGMTVFAPDFACEFWNSDDTQVRIYGDAAVLTSHETMKGTEQGFDFSGQYRVTLIFVRQPDAWHIVAGQGTRVAQQ